MDPTKPNPERFKVYSELPDGKGFTIKGCKFIFKLDRHGGWRDEYGNYYNSNGEPDFEPEDAELTPSEGSLHSDDVGDDYDEFEPNYDEVDDYEEDHYSNWELRNIEKTSRNMETLSSYPAQKPLRIYFTNMPFKVPPKSVYQAYSKRVSGILNIVFDLEDNRRNGEGYFVMEDSKKAESLVKLEGERVLERDVHFDVQKLHELIMDPLKQTELTPFWKPNTSFKTSELKQQKKDDIPRFKAAPAEQKKPESKIEQKQEQKIQSKPAKKVYSQKQEEKQRKPEILKPEIIKPVEKPVQKPVQKIQVKAQVKTQVKTQVKPQVKKDEPSYKTYLLNFEIFESKTRFFTWIGEYKGVKDVDFKNINKQQKEGKIKIFIDFKVDFADKINGKLYNGKKVELKPV